jgi:hypothetical protein
MVNCYTQFIEKKEIIKDINYFYDQIRDLICNEFFGQYQYHKRKKMNPPMYKIEGYLSQCDKTRLQFNNDTIIVTFSTDSKNSRVAITKPIYKNYKIDGITFYINVVLSKQESKSKMIYKENDIFRDLRKHINAVNEYYVKKLRKSEEEKYKTIYNRILRLKKSYYNDWNKLIELVTECVNPKFNNNLCLFKPIIEGMNNGLPMVFKMIHQTQFFKNYEHQKQIKYNRFIKYIKREILDNNELIDLTNELAWCFGHHIYNYSDCLKFIENVINHFNTICYVKEMKINKFASNVWSKESPGVIFMSYEDRQIAKKNGLRDPDFVFENDINYVEEK